MQQRFVFCSVFHEKLKLTNVIQKIFVSVVKTNLQITGVNGLWNFIFSQYLFLLLRWYRLEKW